MGKPLQQTTAFKVQSAVRETKQLAGKLHKMQPTEVGIFLNEISKEIEALGEAQPGMASILYLLVSGIHQHLTEAIALAKEQSKEHAND